jgi:cold shock CspA family protein
MSGRGQASAVTLFNQDKDYGFINDPNSRKSVFVHINQYSEPLVEKNKVTFEMRHDIRDLPLST